MNSSPCSAPSMGASAWAFGSGVSLSTARPIPTYPPINKRGAVPNKMAFVKYPCASDFLYGSADKKNDKGTEIMITRTRLGEDFGLSNNNVNKTNRCTAPNKKNRYTAPTIKQAAVKSLTARITNKTDRVTLDAPVGIWNSSFVAIVASYITYGPIARGRQPHFAFMPHNVRDEARPQARAALASRRCRSRG